MTSSIFTRVSVRRYEDRPVEQEKTDYLLKAAMQAPSAGDQQPWEFYVIKNPIILAKLAPNQRIFRRRRPCTHCHFERNAHRRTALPAGCSCGYEHLHGKICGWLAVK